MSKNSSKNESLMLSDGSVIEFLSTNHEISNCMILTTTDFIYSVINKKFDQKDDNGFDLDWFEEGVPCEFIRHEHSSESWVDGRIRVRLAFLPDRNPLENPMFDGLNDCSWIATSDGDVFRLDVAVLKLPSGHIFHVGKNIFSKKELVNKLRAHLSLNDMDSYRYAWLDYGIPCKVLLDGTNLDGWNSGRICLKVEVRPNLEEVDSEVQSSLDDIRNAIEAN